MTCHLEIGKKRRRKKQLQQGDFRKKYKKRSAALHTKRERRHKKRPEERGYELAGYLALQLHARETLWNTKVGWRMVNSLRCYTQMHPCCHMNYSSPAVCTGFWKNNKKKKDFKAGLKDEWMSSDKGCIEIWSAKKKKKKERSGGSQNTNTVIVTRGRAERRDSAAPASRLIYFFMGVWLMQHREWENTKHTQVRWKSLKGRQNCDTKEKDKHKETASTHFNVLRTRSEALLRRTRVQSARIKTQHQLPTPIIHPVRAGGAQVWPLTLTAAP